jgi:hypothetical protein
MIEEQKSCRKFSKLSHSRHWAPCVGGRLRGRPPPPVLWRNGLQFDGWVLPNLRRSEEAFAVAKLALVYGLRLYPAGELEEVREATVVLKGGRTSRITLHLLEGSLEDIRAQLDQSLSAFFEFYPEI